MKASEVKNFGQLEQFLNEEAKGIDVRRSAWNGFYELRGIARQVDKAFDINSIPRDRRNSQTRYLCYGTLLLGYITFKKTSDGKIKGVTLSCVDKDKSWSDAVSADEKRKSDEEIKATELLKERGFKDLDDLIAYLRKFPKSKIKDIKLNVY